jgi:ABC-type nitrate/sulfonate/bicarbonate transport system substrate-binding protein
MEKLVLTTVSRNFYNLPLWISQQEGFFADEGLEVVLDIHESVDVVTEHLRDGRAQLARGITEHVILDRESGGSLEVVAGSINKLPFSLIAKPSIKTIKDLAGKTIGASSVDAGSSSLIMEILAQEGLRHPDDYHIRAVGPMLSRWELLQTGEIDCGLQGVPMNFIALDAGFVTLCEPRDRFPDFQFSSLNVDARWARENRAVLVRFLRAYLRSHEWFYLNREAASTIAAREMGLAEAYAARAWDECVAEAIMPRDARASVAAIQALIDISGLIRALKMRTKARAEDYMNESYLAEACATLQA